MAVPISHGEIFCICNAFTQRDRLDPLEHSLKSAVLRHHSGDLLLHYCISGVQADFLMLCHVDGNSRKNPLLRSQSPSKYVTTQWDCHEKSIPFLYIYPCDPYSMRPNQWAMASQFASDNWLKEVLDWSPPPLPIKGGHGWMAFLADSPGMLFLGMWLVRISSWSLLSSDPMRLEE